MFLDYMEPIGQTNFGDIDVNKHGIVKRLNDAGKEGRHLPYNS